MQKLLKEYLDDLNRRQKKRRKAVIASLLLVVLVVGSVLGSLTQYGIAMTDKAKCGLEEHEHSEKCYEKVLTCGLEETEGHTHTEDCRPKETEKSVEEDPSEETETKGHEHTKDCYGDPELVCEEEEVEGHTHTEDCYTETEPEQELICESSQEGAYRFLGK